jgi:hypothetical protein
MRPNYLGCPEKNAFPADGEPGGLIVYIYNWKNNWSYLRKLINKK